MSKHDKLGAQTTVKRIFSRINSTSHHYKGPPPKNLADGNYGPCDLCGKTIFIKYHTGHASNEFHYAPCGYPCAGRRLLRTLKDAYLTSGGSHTILWCPECGPMPTPHGENLLTPTQRKRTKDAMRRWCLKRMENGLTAYPQPFNRKRYER